MSEGGSEHATEPMSMLDDFAGPLNRMEAAMKIARPKRERGCCLSCCHREK